MWLDFQHSIYHLKPFNIFAGSSLVLWCEMDVDKGAFIKVFIVRGKRFFLKTNELSCMQQLSNLDLQNIPSGHYSSYERGMTSVQSKIVQGHSVPCNLESFGLGWSTLCNNNSTILSRLLKLKDKRLIKNSSIYNIEVEGHDIAQKHTLKMLETPFSLNFYFKNKSYCHSRRKMFNDFKTSV